MSFNDFVQRHKLKNEATSNLKIQQVLSSLGLSDVGICLWDDSFWSNIRIVNLHPSKGTHWVADLNKIFLNSYACVCPKKLSKFIINWNGHCLLSQ